MDREYQQLATPRPQRAGPDDRPTHVVAQPGDRHSLCGIKNPLPVVAAFAVAAHVAGHGMVVCDDCERKLKGSA